MAGQEAENGAGVNQGASGTRERTDRAGHRQGRAKEGLGAGGDAARPEARRKYGAMPRVWAWDGIGPCPCP